MVLVVKPRRRGMPKEKGMISFTRIEPTEVPVVNPKRGFVCACDVKPAVIQMINPAIPVVIKITKP